MTITTWPEAFAFVAMCISVAFVAKVGWEPAWIGFTLFFGAMACRSWYRMWGGYTKRPTLFRGWSPRAPDGRPSTEVVVDR